MSAPLQTGLLVLHGNRLELLGHTVFAWLAAHPLGPLETESFLVQSNGMAEWLKMELAGAHGVCAATRVELPARFIWRAYRAVLGRAAVPAHSALDKLPLTWRFMQMLPQAVAQPGFEPVAAFLRGPHGGGPGNDNAEGGDATRRLQLARRLADLFDQYQVYRSDWLADWAEGRDVLAWPRPEQPPAVPDDQRWQPALWRLVLQALDPEERQAARAVLHQRFLQALQTRPGDPAGQSPRPFPDLPRRLVLFGTTHIPHQTLEAIAALAGHCQVVLAVPNPCRFHWADLIEGRELLRAERRRHPARAGRDLSTVPPEALHLHGHPLLAAWGRQARDFTRQLDAYDDAEAARRRFGGPDRAGLRLDLFDESPGQGLLQQVQAAVRDLLPLAEHPAGVRAAERAAERPAAIAAEKEPSPLADATAEAAVDPAAASLVPPDDRSIVFHMAHSAQREVEILHDQLLHLLAHPPADPDAQAEALAETGTLTDTDSDTGAGHETRPPTPLRPRDIVVMVPDIETFASAIRSVFGQYARGHARHIPWGIADQPPRGRQPLLVALEWLLRLPQQRVGASEVRTLLEVPPLARRFGLEPEDLPDLVAWIEGAGVRWGLDAAHRASLGLGEAGDANTWAFGLRRMLLGYATGELAEAPGHLGIEPYAEVAGLAAGLAGPLADLLALLQDWWRDAGTLHAPEAWAERLRRLMKDLFEATDDTERALLAALDDALAAWLQACETAGFDAPVELAVAREAWLDGLDEPGVSRRFKAGGVTFCTLLPLRAIPFDVVCLLGMNDGDYPRRSPRSDFDLLGLPGQARPGDRSRRHDDRQLMLDALLSARRVLYVSWAGRSPRDNQTQPPSVLVAQLRDYLDAGWGRGTAAARTTAHPLQPFSRVYFEPPAPGRDPALLTYAAEWRAAHAAPPASSAVSSAAATATTASEPLRVTLADLEQFLRNPVKAYFRHRLQVDFGDPPAASVDDESFSSSGLDRWGQIDDVLRACRRLGAMGGEGGEGAEGTDEAITTPVSLAVAVSRETDRLQRAGRLPLGGPGVHVRAGLDEALQPMLLAWQESLDAHPVALEPLHLHLELPATADGAPALVLDDALGGLRGAAEDPLGTAPLWIDLQASRLTQKDTSGKSGQGQASKPAKPAKPPKPPALQVGKLVLPWLRALASAAMGRPVRGRVIAPGAVVDLAACTDMAAARHQLDLLLSAWREALGGPQPWPTAVATGLAWLEARQPKRAKAPAVGEPDEAAGTGSAPTAGKTEAELDANATRAYEGGYKSPVPGEGREACLQRLYPDFASLRAQPGFEAATRALYEPLLAWSQAQAQARVLEGLPEDDEDGSDD